MDSLYRLADLQRTGRLEVNKFLMNHWFQQVLEKMLLKEAAGWRWPQMQASARKYLRQRWL